MGFTVPMRMLKKGLPFIAFGSVLMLLLVQLPATFKPLVLSWKNEELVRTLQDLQKTQRLNSALQLQAMNASNLLSQNSSTLEGSELPRTTRLWFDSRPDVNASTMDLFEHQFFLGYIIENPDLCNEEKVDILIYVHSAVSHREERRGIRESWANTQIFTDISIKRIFILGKAEDTLQQLHVDTEYSAYGDIVQGNFLDTFKNLTYKALTMLAWVNTHCSQARYIMKADDDMFVDTFRVVRELVPKLSVMPSGVACDHKTDMPIPREHGRWYVPDSLLPNRTTWPPFCSGYFTLMTGNVIPKLLEASFNVEDFVPIDDAYLYGLLCEGNVTMEIYNIHGQISPSERPDPVEEIQVNNKFEFLAFRSKMASDFRRLWSARSHKLTEWEQAHSFFARTFQKDQSVVIF
ncbi:beta-1,3-galactosyltransferase 5-like [Physella acuta]|uniref:beta-1,3-galactosyltransferase 5-like n=1 Tax=Physella acuta TaxID=109671 RepID=UPI0027DAFCC8|nr:beta-1,3-galactosyltransferase 5-like [Physella acuta]